MLNLLCCAVPAAALSPFAAAQAIEAVAAHVGVSVDKILNGDLKAIMCQVLKNHIVNGKHMLGDWQVSRSGGRGASRHLTVTRLWVVLQYASQHAFTQQHVDSSNVEAPVICAATMDKGWCWRTGPDCSLPMLLQSSCLLLPWEAACGVQHVLNQALSQRIEAWLSTDIPAAYLPTAC